MDSIICKYIESSWEANMIMSGLESKIDKRYSDWTRSHVSSLKRAIKGMEKPVQKPMILYRGAQASPILEEITDEHAIQRFQTKIPIINQSPISTSTSRTIAKEFIYRKGYLHVLHLDAGVKVLDFKRVSCADEGVMKTKIREKEIIISPNHEFIPIKRYKDIFHWRVVKRNV